ncbi:hypothetical protein [Pseudarthrobacter polychromogenes]|uniref:Tetratricopeptide repeat protein n=1 Tax=Pseudarthrobacter polychromogenes TaxID=1676 RepID=A0ABQ1X9K8_9MICC|nr:hypothetical protein [Pseudarthrobacter polychromogenes]GGG84432.1 hypothetical protein GCM10011577_02530 [Pseudarthrobacter polychromogenes]
MTSARHGMDRRTSRRRLLAWSAIPVILMLCVAAKLLSLGLLGARAAGAYEANDAASVRSAAEALHVVNLIEPHKAPLAAGDADVLAGDFAAARLRFEEALGLVPPRQSGSAEACVIRVNLVLAIERLGDEKLGAEDPAAAAVLFEEALAAVAAAPDDCFSEHLPADTGDRLAGAEVRLQEKLADTRQEQEQDPDPAPETGQEEGPGEDSQESAQQSKLEQLEDSARQAQRERNSGREREDYLDDSGDSAGTSRPW